MNKRQFPLSGFLMAVCITAVISSCSKSDPGPAQPVDACQGKTIVITTTITDASACGATGKIKVSASGSTGFSFKLNSGGTYQTDDSFSNLAAGSYTVFAKDAAGCEKSVSATVASGGAAGPLFTAVKALMVVKCQPCHNNTQQNGGMNWEVECNIVAKSARINERAVVQGTMPPTGPLLQSEKNAITNWINAGAKYSD